MRLPDFDGTVLLTGVAGSQAFGLATPESDIDRAGVYAVPTRSLFDLNGITESHHGKGDEGDYTFHEAGKFVKLALGGNPSILEQMWLPEYDYLHTLGHDLIEIRQAFLSAKRVEDAYFGYAVQQLKKLKSRGDGTFGPDVKNRTAKHARHLCRLMEQGFELYAWGTLTVRVADPDAVREFGERVATGDIAAAEAVVNTHRDLFKGHVSALPDEPDRGVVQDWLYKVRDHFYDRCSE